MTAALFDTPDPQPRLPRRRPALAAGSALALALLLGCNGQSLPLELTLVPPADAMPVPGAQVVFQAVTRGGGTVHFQWLKNGSALHGATAATLVLGPVTLADAGSYQVRASDGASTLTSPAFDLEPADAAWVVTSSADSGPGSLRDTMAQANAAPGVNGIQFRLGPGPHTIRLASTLPPVTGDLRILGPVDAPVTLDGGGDPAQGAAGGHRAFILNGGSLALDQLTVQNCLAQGGGSRGGGGAAGMGGAVFINQGALALVRVTFQGNRAQGGSSAPGGDGSFGGGGGAGGDGLEDGAGGPGLLGGAGGGGVLDGSGNGIPAVLDGAGGGAARGGPLSTDPATWQDNLSGGNGDWGGGGGFSVGPHGGGGNASFGGGGGGSGGRVGTTLVFTGDARGAGGTFGGDGSNGSQSAGRTGQGGGGAGLGGAIFLRAGTLTMSQCVFLDNAAVPGQGAEAGFGKGGAIFIYPLGEQAPMAPDTLLAQTYQGNTAADAGVENAGHDNNDFYIAQVSLLAKPGGTPLGPLYRRYRQVKALGLPWP